MAEAHALSGCEVAEARAPVTVPPTGGITVCLLNGKVLEAMMVRGSSTRHAKSVLDDSDSSSESLNLFGPPPL
jgi:hypothetical protein